jgi:hypothetical protein
VLGEQLAQPRNFARLTYSERGDGNSVAAHYGVEITFARAALEHNLVVRRRLPQSLQANAVNVAPPSCEWDRSRFLAENCVGDGLALVGGKLPVVATGYIAGAVDIRASRQKPNPVRQPIAVGDHADRNEHLIQLNAGAVIKEKRF